MTRRENGEGVAKTSVYKNETFCLSQHLAFNPTSGVEEKTDLATKNLHVLTFVMAIMCIVIFMFIGHD
jgi:hypothetical protein